VIAVFFLPVEVIYAQDELNTLWRRIETPAAGANATVG